MATATWSFLRRTPARGGYAVVVTLLIAVSRLSAEDPVPAERVDQLVKALDAGTRVERAAAERELLAAGTGVLDLLPPPDLAESPAVREALRRIRVQLELAAAEASVQPSRVTLTGTHTVPSAVDEIERQTGNELRADRLPAAVRSKPQQLELSGATFWEAVAELSSQWDLSWTIDDDTGDVRLVEPSNEAERIAFDPSGTFAVSCVSATVGERTVRLDFELFAEPRLRPLFVAIADADFAAEIDDAELPLFSPRARTELPMTSRGPARFAVIFQRPESLTAGASLQIDGRAVVHTAAAPTQVRFAELASPSPVSRRRGGVTVTLQRSLWLPHADDTHEARIALAVSYDAGGPEFESHRTWIYHNEVWLEAPDGRRFPANDGFDTTAQADGGVALVYRFQNLPRLPAADWEFVYVAPTLLIDVPVEFGFSIPLPPADAAD